MRKSTNKLTEIIIKLEERGVISKAQAEAARHYAKKLASPAGKLAVGAVRYAVVKAIAELILGDGSDG